MVGVAKEALASPITGLSLQLGGEPSHGMTPPSGVLTVAKDAGHQCGRRLETFSSRGWKSKLPSALA